MAQGDRLWLQLDRRGDGSGLNQTDLGSNLPPCVWGQVAALL